MQTGINHKTSTLWIKGRDRQKLTWAELQSISAQSFEHQLETLDLAGFNFALFDRADMDRIPFHFSYVKISNSFNIDVLLYCLIKHDSLGVSCRLTDLEIIDCSYESDVKNMLIALSIRNLTLRRIAIRERPLMFSRPRDDDDNTKTVSRLNDILLTNSLYIHHLGKSFYSLLLSIKRTLGRNLPKDISKMIYKLIREDLVEKRLTGGDYFLKDLNSDRAVQLKKEVYKPHIYTDIVETTFKYYTDDLASHLKNKVRVESIKVSKFINRDGIPRQLRFNNRVTVYMFYDLIRKAHILSTSSLSFNAIDFTNTGSGSIRNGTYKQLIHYEEINGYLENPGQAFRIIHPHFPVLKVKYFSFHKCIYVWRAIQALMIMLNYRKDGRACQLLGAEKVHLPDYSIEQENDLFCTFDEEEFTLTLTEKPKV